MHCGRVGRGSDGRGQLGPALRGTHPSSRTSRRRGKLTGLWEDTQALEQEGPATGMDGRARGKQRHALPGEQEREGQEEKHCEGAVSAGMQLKIVPSALLDPQAPSHPFRVANSPLGE